MADGSSVKHICLNVPFPTGEHASLAFDVLNVDKELKRSNVQRNLTVNGSNVLINFYGNDLKKLRVAVNSCLKNVILIIKTINQFPNK